MRNLLLILVSMVFIAGCGTSLKNSWTNFRAYYNTYYNAQKNFGAGIKKVEEQPFTIDPAEPVRIHSVPNQAGNSDFQKTIDKGARILRKFPTSHLVDDALLLIGKSYYYRHEYFSALQKFEELRNASKSPKMEQSAIIWKGRTQLDLNTYTEGASFLEMELARYPNNWSVERKGEIQALAGQHHTMMENWEQAAEHLSAAVSNIENKKLLGRSLFLYGQVLEQLERYGEAYFTFSRVSDNFPSFEYTFWARYKQADVARKEGNLDQAISIYESLHNDDKNSDRRNELTFEIARTHEMKGDAKQAEQYYKELLYDDQSQQRRSLKADIYFRLGKIYSDHYDEYPVAAAYFDSSSTLSEAPKKSETEEDAEILADAFGQYTDLQNTIYRADSLLRLGSLTETQLDSALERARAQKRRELLSRQESETEQRLVNENLIDQEPQSTASSTHGFLNHQNRELADRAQANFRVIWGNRPLVDNWRRMEVVRRSNVRNRTSDTTNEQLLADEEEMAAVEINLDEIPQTPEERDELELEKANAWYELGNLFFINLNQPDSARHYFHKVIDNGVNPELRPRAMYSLFELFTTTDNQDSLKYWGQQVLQEYSDSRFARRVENRLNGNPDQSLEPDSTEGLRHQLQEILASSAPGKANRLKQLALENQSSELASHIYYESIQQYIREAKQQPDSLSKASFIGARWDSVRTVIDEFDVLFPNAEQSGKVNKLRELLEQSDTSTELPTCEELGSSLAVQPGMDEFLTTVEYPDKLEGMSLSGEVVYSFVVTATGEIESFELVSQRTSLGIEDAFEQAFDRTLTFAPLQMDNPPKRVRCEVKFPIQH